MTPDEVPAELVDLAYLAIDPAGFSDPAAGDKAELVQDIRGILAATMPKTQADALREIATFLATKTLPTVDGVDIVEWMLKTADYVETL